MKLCVILFIFSIVALIFDYIILRKIYKKYEELKKLKGTENHGK